MWVPGVTEMCVIGGLGLLIFGNRLPSVARSIGSSFVEFKKGLRGIEDGADDLLGDFNDVKKEAQKQLQEVKEQAEKIVTQTSQDVKEKVEKIVKGKNDIGST